MIVYRWEHPVTLEGPYNHMNGNVYDALGRDTIADPVKTPIYRKDGITIPSQYEEWKFAFASIKQAEAWFDSEERTAFLVHGFKFERYQIKAADVLLGGHQVAFRWRNAKRLKTLLVNEAY
jgi:hypothetical protein